MSVLRLSNAACSGQSTDNECVASIYLRLLVSLPRIEYRLEERSQKTPYVHKSPHFLFCQQPAGEINQFSIDYLLVDAIVTVGCKA
jgi:hypothetical protein